jgi:hypothetical protein
MSDIIFEYTPRSIYASQGAGPTVEEGYDIWIKNGDELLFIGFCYIHELEENMKIYQDQGDSVYIRRQKLGEEVRKTVKEQIDDLFAYLEEDRESVDLAYWQGYNNGYLNGYTDAENKSKE